jgi:predicted PurR-regulated permease PerM
MKQRNEVITLDISWYALLKVLAFCVGAWLFVVLSDMFILLFGVLILVAAINPTIARWQQYMSRPLAVSLFYALLVAALSILASVFVPAFISQVNDLAHNIPRMAEAIRGFLPNNGSDATLNNAVESLRSNLTEISGSLVRTTLAIFGGLATVITGLVISFYLLLEENNAKDFFHQVLPQKQFESVYHTVSKISERMGMWVRGQAILMLVIGIFNFIAYVALGIPTPLPLAIWAGLCEVIPFVGPVIGVLPALLVALSSGNIVQALLLLAIGFVLIQQLENHIIVPKLMSRAVGLSPVLVILAVAVGAQLLGLVGALIAVPVAAIISVVVGEWSELRKIWEN